MRILQKVTSSKKIHKWKTGLIDQANESKLVYLSADSNVALLKVNCHLYVEYYLTQKVLFSLLTYDS